jgi:cytochrome c553
MFASRLRTGFLSTLAPCLLLGLLSYSTVRANEERVDRLTKSALSLDVDPKRGAAIFGQYCARCHGNQAHGNASRAIPALAGQRFAYLVRQLANFSGGERDNDTMHGVVAKSELHDPQTWVDVAGYLNSAAVARFEKTGDGSHVALGRGIFHEQCAPCHRADARGDDAGFVPSLRNQHYSYLVNQLHQLADGARHNVDENLVRFLRSFDEQDVAAVADYLSRLRGPGVDRKRMRDNGAVVD